MVHSPPGEPPGGIFHDNIGGQIVAMQVPPGVVAGQTLQNQVPQPQQTQQMQRHTRVLWDIENVSVPSGIDANEAVRALERWLETRGLWGAGVRGLITAFFNPDSVGTKIRDALNRANVEQVLASSKREDADRKLNARLERDLELLPTGAATAVVFITADMDFIEQLRRVRERGGPTVLLTTAPHGSAHYNALAHSATETHLWCDIVCTAPAPPPPLPPPPPMEAAAVKAAAVKAAAEKAAAEKAAAKKAKKRAKKEKQKEKKKAKDVGDEGTSKAAREYTEGGWLRAGDATVGDDDDHDDDDDDDDDDDAPPVFVPVARGSPGQGSSNDPIAPPVRDEAKCTYWDGRGGWGWLSSVQHGGKLYVKNKALCAACGHELRRGDRVSYALGSNLKGPCAVDVKLVARAPALPAVLGMRNHRAASVRV